ncbi:MAG: hypothetical protein IJY04_02795 [Clostridia bacterium]|nr:hypothetical protein [Clostridia bacterium]
MMKKQEKLDIINKCIAEKLMCRCYFIHFGEGYYDYYYPNAVSDRLVFLQKENDFILNGYTVRKLSHLKRVELRNDKCDEINRWSGLTEQVCAPDVDITSWETVLDSLEELECLIIIENEAEDEFHLGRIERVMRNLVVFRPIDADGIISESTIIIPYSSITSVSWDTRYANGWAKYLTETALEGSQK